MPRAIDFHVHLPTTEFMHVTLGPYAQVAERFFRTEVKLKDIEQIAADYAALDMIGVLLAWNAETATGHPPLGNDYIAAIVGRYPQQFIGFASVDPHKGKTAIKENELLIITLFAFQDSVDAVLFTAHERSHTLRHSVLPPD